MAIQNYVCPNCDRVGVCKHTEKIVKFADSVKTPMGIDITLDNCENYAPIEEDYQPDTI